MNAEDNDVTQPNNETAINTDIITVNVVNAAGLDWKIIWKIPYGFPYPHNNCEIVTKK